jgi:hypothetical protein
MATILVHIDHKYKWVQTSSKHQLLLFSLHVVACVSSNYPLLHPSNMYISIGMMASLLNILQALALHSRLHFIGLDKGSELQHSVRRRMIQKIISGAVRTDSRSHELNEDMRRAHTKKTAGSWQRQTCRAFSLTPHRGQSGVSSSSFCGEQASCQRHNDPMCVWQPIDACP